MFGQGCLNQDFASQLPTPGAPCNLAQQLEGPLTGPEIRKVDPHVGIYHTHESHPRKVQSLGDHLSPEKNVHLPSPEPTQNLVVGPFPRSGIDIHPGDPGPWERLGHHPFHLFSPQPFETQILRSASAAPLRGRLLMTTVVTEEPSGHSMEGEGNRASKALPNVSALPALDEVGVSSPVQEEDDLLLPVKPFLDSFHQLWRKDSTAEVPCLPATFRPLILPKFP